MSPLLSFLVSIHLLFPVHVHAIGADLDSRSQQFQTRLCERVNSRFRDTENVWYRVNSRIKSRFGFTCEKNLSLEQRCINAGGAFLDFSSVIDWSRCDCPGSTLFDSASSKCLERSDKCTIDGGVWRMGSDSCWEYDANQCYKVAGCKSVTVSDGVFGDFVSDHCEPTNYCTCPNNQVFGNSGCVEPGHPSMISIPAYIEQNQ